MRFQDILAKLQKVMGPNSTGRFTALCPGHEDKRESLTVWLDKDKILVKCQAGCSFEHIVQSMGLEEKDFFVEDPKKTAYEHKERRERREIEKIYTYTDENNKELFECVRFRPKDFQQRHIENGKYVWNLLGVRRVLYHLPQLIQATRDNRIILLVEGEKDVETAERLGFAATTSPMGAGKWHTEYNPYLIDADVIVVPDIDKPDPKKPGVFPGLVHANRVLNSLYNDGARKLRQLILSENNEKKIDLTDWVEAGGTREQLQEWIASLPLWEPETKGAEAVKNLPVIDVSYTHIRDKTAAALEALCNVNDPPFLFVRSRELSRIVCDENNMPRIDILSKPALRGILDRSANFIKTTSKGGEVPMDPPLEMVEDILSLHTLPFPPLAAITETPIIKSDGSIRGEPGYDPETKLYYYSSNNLKLPEIIDEPTSDDVKDCSCLLMEMICDFPFEDNASKANAIGAIMTPVLRPLIHGMIPMALFNKPRAGTGASLLASLVYLVATGRSSAITTAPEDDEEWKKIITSLLLQGRNIITIDNIENKLFSPSLAAVLTNEVWEGRILGLSKTVPLSAKVVWLGTGNNIRLGGDLPRRCYWIRLDAKEARPWQREKFSHPDLAAWVEENRGNLLAAILTIARAWIQAGKPRYKLPIIGGYQGWINVVGNVLKFADIPNFLDNLDEMYDFGDEDAQEWENFVKVWHDALGDTFFTVPGLVKCVQAHAELSEAVPIDLLENKGFESTGFTRKLGKALAKRAGVHYTNDLVIVKGPPKHKAASWAIKTKQQVLEAKEKAREEKQSQSEFDIDVQV